MFKLSKNQFQCGSTTPKQLGDPPPHHTLQQVLGRDGYTEEAGAGRDALALPKASSAFRNHSSFLASAGTGDGGAGASPRTPASRGWAPGLRVASRCRTAVGPHPSVCPHATQWEGSAPQTARFIFWAPSGMSRSPYAVYLLGHVSTSAIHGSWETQALTWARCHRIERRSPRDGTAPGTGTRMGTHPFGVPIQPTEEAPFHSGSVASSGTLPSCPRLPRSLLSCRRPAL
ncbi:hypothetical protein HJG60_008963 [Phyllostomus discolor]|uniref:Uncharacterized protein n=1 Tax=Phyllostomus discolor TaxID=89673 RepID=A0A833YZE2_9CHIR|nr:hypothetical protein HJG60_008963 [Phyllostomus discolor]